MSEKCPFCGENAERSFLGFACMAPGNCPSGHQIFDPGTWQAIRDIKAHAARLRQAHRAALAMLRNVNNHLLAQNIACEVLNNHLEDTTSTRNKLHAEIKRLRESLESIEVIGDYNSSSIAEKALRYSGGQNDRRRG